MLDELGEPDGGDELDGLELHDRLGRLFVAADRLANDPNDRAGSRDIADSYEAIEHAAVPFGVDAGVWLELHRSAVGLIDAVAGAEAGERDTHEFDDDSGEDGSTDDVGDDVVTSHAADGDGPEGADAAPSVQAQARTLRDLLRRFV